MKRVDIRRFLDTGDLVDKDMPITSVLDSRCLDEIADRVLRFEGAPLHRPYIANPLKFVFTVTKSTFREAPGSPYAITSPDNIIIQPWPLSWMK